MSCSRSRCRSGWIVGAVVVLAGCEGKTVGETGQPTGAEAEVQAPPAPTFAAPDQADRAAVIAYARTLRFVTDPLRMDEQTLSVTRAARTVARVEPTLYAGSLTYPQRARGAFLGRIISTGSYAPMALRRGVQYLWVDSSASGWRALVIPENPADSVRVTSLGIFDHGETVRISSARFFETRLGYATWWRCGKECCSPCTPVGITCPDPWMSRILPDQLPAELTPGGRDPRFTDSVPRP